MSTLTGWGTMYWGWRPQSDGTFIATEWLTAFFVPLLPLRRDRLRLGEGSQTQESLIVASGIDVREFRYAVVERLRLSASEVARTYFATYVLGPVLLFWPWALLAYAASRLPRHWMDHRWFPHVLIGAFLLGMCNLVVVVALGLRRGRVFDDAAGTFEGFGTMYYGWRPNADGTAFATKWLVVMWAPLVPLARHHLRWGDPGLFPPPENRGLLGGVPVQNMREYTLLSAASPALGEVLSTYAWTYVLGPVMLGFPILAVWNVGAWLDQRPRWRESTADILVLLMLGVLVLANLIAVGLYARRNSGFPWRPPWRPAWTPGMRGPKPPATR